MVRLHTELTLASFPVHLKDTRKKNNWIENDILAITDIVLWGLVISRRSVTSLKALESEGAAVVGRLLD